jgi:hypothetical protein
MNQFDSILFREIPVISKIIQDETWLEGERRGCQVPSHDAAVRENVCKVILRIGQELRESIEAQLRSAVNDEEMAVVVRTAVASSAPVGNEAA